jgi:hypothetical protein
MKTEWKAFLAEAGAEFDATTGILTDFGNPERERRAATGGNVLIPLSHETINVTGSDAESFLQGQLTNDVTRLTAAHAELAGYCSPKGRLLAIFLLGPYGPGYWLRVPEGLAAPLIKRLRLFVLRADVGLEDVSNSWIGFGVSGPDADQQVHEVVGSVPTAVNELVTTEDRIVIRRPGPFPRFELLARFDRAKADWYRFNVHGTPVGPTNWRLLDILCGHPAIFPESQDLFLPQAVNLDQWDGISFQKGCYPGQEVVARTHYRGKLKRRMVGARIDARSPPAPGTTIHRAAETEVVGHVVDAALHGDGLTRAQIVVSEAVTPGQDTLYCEGEVPVYVDAS